MKKKSITILVVVGVVAVALLWGIGINNKLVNTEENVTLAWGQVENAYKRRADLIPQLVSTVQGAANYEKGTLTEVIEARAKAGSVQVDANNLTEANVAEFQKWNATPNLLLLRGSVICRYSSKAPKTVLPPSVGVSTMR